MSGPPTNCSLTASRQHSWISCIQSSTCFRGGMSFITEVEGHYPLLVKRGSVQVAQRFPARKREGQTALLLRKNLSTLLVQVAVLMASPKAPKSQNVFPCAGASAGLGSARVLRRPRPVDR